MSEPVEIKIPDIGDFDEVDVVEILVAVGDSVAVDDSLITIESDKASMEVPSTVAGVIKTVSVSLGDKVSEGSVIAVIEPSDSTESAGDSAPESTEPAPESVSPAAETVAIPTSVVESAATRAEPDPAPESTAYDFDLLVLGSGPGGYAAAFRAADLGLTVVMVERYSTLGGVCLNVGCIPSKALLHAARVIEETREMAEHGLDFGDPRIDLDKLRGWKSKVVGRLTGGLEQLAERRKVEVITGVGTFASPHTLEVEPSAVESGASTRTVSFGHAIIAAGSSAVELPFIPHDDPRVVTSTGALELESVPERLLVIGGGIIGLEMATVYDALGSKVTVVELMDRLMVGADKDLVRPLVKRLEKRYESILLSTRVTAVHATDDGLVAQFEGDGAPERGLFDQVLVAVGRSPNGKLIGADRAGVLVDDRGSIRTDDQMRTNVPHIHAIGDITQGPMLAHKATHEGKVAAEVIAGLKSGFDAAVIPSVAYTDPEVAWVGVTEEEAREQGLDFGKGTFPWAASGRSLALGREDGMTKLLFDSKTGRIIGAGIVGPNAGDLITEAALAIEMGADAQDLALTIHPHPTLSETVGQAAEAFEGTIVDLYMPKKRR